MVIIYLEGSVEPVLDVQPVLQVRGLIGRVGGAQAQDLVHASDLTLAQFELGARLRHHLGREPDTKKYL